MSASASPPIRPVSLKKEGDDRLVIVWSDGHHGEYTWRHLRDACPCAGCREERLQPADPLRVLKPSELLPLRPIAAADGWCEDPADRRYNRPIQMLSGAPGDRLTRAVDDRAVEMTGQAGRNDGPQLHPRVHHHRSRPGQRHVEVRLGRALSVGVDHGHQIEERLGPSHPVDEGAGGHLRGYGGDRRRRRDHRRRVGGGRRDRWHHRSVGDAQALDPVNPQLGIHHCFSA